MPKADKAGEKRAAGCTGKTVYTNIDEARRIARYIWREQRDRVAPYRCIRCNGFHIGRHEREAHPMKDI